MDKETSLINDTFLLTDMASFDYTLPQMNLTAAFSYRLKGDIGASFKLSNSNRREEPSAKVEYFMKIELMG